MFLWLFRAINHLREGMLGVADSFGDNIECFCHSNRILSVTLAKRNRCQGPDDGSACGLQRLFCASQGSSTSYDYQRSQIVQRKKKSLLIFAQRVRKKTGKRPTVKEISLR